MPTSDDMPKQLQEIVRVRMTKKVKRDLTAAARKMHTNGKRVTVSDLLRNAADVFIQEAKK